MKKIGHEVFYVSFKFGSMAYVGVDMYEGLTIEECLKLRSEEIDAYIKYVGNGKYELVKIA